MLHRQVYFHLCIWSAGPSKQFALTPGRPLQGLNIGGLLRPLQYYWHDEDRRTPQRAGSPAKWPTSTRSRANSEGVCTARTSNRRFPARWCSIEDACSTWPTTSGHGSILEASTRSIVTVLLGGWRFWFHTRVALQDNVKALAHELDDSESACHIGRDASKWESAGRRIQNWLSCTPPGPACGTQR